MMVSELSHGEKDKYHMNSLTSAVYRNKLIDAGHGLVFTRGKGAPKVAIVIKNPPAKEVDIRDLGSIPGLGRSPGEGNGSSVQYSCLENSIEEEPGRLQFMGFQSVGHD